jgi:LuxR family maltose regulon positive regulatory protein
VQIGLGMIYLELGQVEDAYQALKRASPVNQRAGNRYGFLSSINVLMQVDTVRGTLKRAHANGKKGLMWIEEWSRTDKRQRRPARMLAYFRLHMGIVQYEWNELKKAAENLQKACDYYALVQSWHQFSCQAYQVDLHQALGDTNRAVDSLRKLQRLGFMLEHSLLEIPMAAWIAGRSLLLSQSRPELSDLHAEAVMWAENSGLDPKDDLRGKQEYEYVILAKVLLAQDRGEQATPLLDRLIQSAESAGRWGDLIVYLSLQAAAQYSLGHRDLALAHLSRAMTLAEPEGYIRTFVDLGPAMHDLLKIVAGKDVSTIYTAKLLVAFPKSDEKTSLSHSRPSFPQDTAALTEPLNDREMQILRLMSARLSNREIAEELYLSVNTVKWYASSIYVKLGAANRREAGSRARDLRLL